MAKRSAIKKKAKPARTELSARERLFVAEYLRDLNGTQAAIRAGYAESGAHVQASRMLRNAKIVAEIDAANKERLSRIGQDADSLLARLIAEANADVADIFTDDNALKPVKEWPAIWRRGLIAGVKVYEEYEKVKDEATGIETKVSIGRTVEVKTADRAKRLELFGRHVKVSAFKDKVEHSVAQPLQELFKQIAGNAIRPGGAAKSAEQA